MSMKKYCAVISCENNRGISIGDNSITCFRPKHPATIEKWKAALESLGLKTSKMIICSLHFDPKDLYPSRMGVRWKPGAVPTVKSISIDYNEVDPIEVFDDSHIDDKIPARTVMISNNITVHPTNEVQRKEIGIQCSDYKNQLFILEAKYKIINNKYKEQTEELQNLKKLKKKIFYLEAKCKRLKNQTCCDVCFENSNWLKVHKCIAHSNIKCEYCSEVFVSTNELICHLRYAEHTSMKMYKCSKCSFCAPADLLLKFHQMSETSRCAKTRKFFTCYLCKKMFRNRTQLKDHLDRHVAARDQKCDVCVESLTFNELNEHLCDSEKSLTCEFCPRSFNVTAELLQHLESHQERVLHRCRECSKYFGMEYLRNIHERTHQNEIKLFTCDICEKRFAKKHNLQAHLQVHTMKREFLCSQCGKEFKTYLNLKQHSLSHGARIFHCSECPKTFRSHSGLLKHRRHHQDLRLNVKYKCTECNFESTSRNTINEHKSTHLFKERNKKCPLCPWAFTENSSLKKHMKKHNGSKPFECEFCNKKYVYKGDLRKHLQTHVGNNIYQCDKCGQGFRLQADLRHHFYEHYKQKPDQIE